MKQQKIPASRHLLQAGLAIALSLSVTPGISEEKVISLPKAKQTSLGLYVTAGEAYEKWLTDPDNIIVLDVRTTEEYIYTGHAPMAWNVPLASQTYQWDDEKNYFGFQPNPHFITQVAEFAQPSDTILVMCRSGGRSAMAVNQLAKAGFTDVYQVTDGFEGDAVKEPGSVFKGRRLKNGWKNSGNPWTYQPEPGRMRFAHKESKE